MFFIGLTFLIFTENVLSDLSSSEKEFLLEAHNEFRRRTDPPAANMLEMEWEDPLARVAQDYAEDCDFTHNSDRSTEYAENGGRTTVGENIAAGTDGFDLDDFLEWWWEEWELLDSGNDEDWADVGGAGHYTQIVWWESEMLGCGFEQEDGCAGYEKYLVCNYAPQGNWFGDEPYTAGEPCSRCPSSHPYCNDGLCSRNSFHPPASPPPPPPPDTTYAETCACTGEANSRGEGSSCREWDVGGKFCYCTSGCSDSERSSSIPGAHFCEQCDGYPIVKQDFTPSTSDICACTGQSNSRGEGSSCRNWDTGGRFCFCTEACEVAQRSETIPGSHFCDPCDDIPHDDGILDDINDINPDETPSTTEQCGCTGQSNRFGEGSYCRDWREGGEYCYCHEFCENARSSEEIRGAFYCEACRDLMLRPEPGTCKCTGESNSRGEGSFCDKWDNDDDEWCYCSSTCPNAEPSAQIKESHFCSECIAFKNAGRSLSPATERSPPPAPDSQSEKSDNNGPQRDGVVPESDHRTTCSGCCFGRGEDCSLPTGRGNCRGNTTLSTSRTCVDGDCVPC